MVRLSVLLILGVWAAYTFLFPKGTEAAWKDADWKYRKTITILEAQVSGSGSHTNFPVLIQITDADLKNFAQDDGDDIMFTSSDGTTKLDHELTSFNKTTGGLTAWVEIPTLSATADTEIYIYYGNPTASAQQNAAGTWGNSYQAVYHMEESSGNRSDSSANNNTLTDNNTVTSSTGKVGTAANFVRANDEWLSITDAAQTGLDITGNITVETWIRGSDISNGSNNVIVSKDGGSGNASYVLRSPNSNATFRASGDGTNFTSATGLSTLSNTTWYYVVGIYNGTNLYVYVNGVEDRSVAYSSGIFNSSAAFEVGARAGGNNNFDGDIDEVRVSNTNRSVDWIVTSYNNQNNPSSFVSVGTEVESAPIVLYWKFDEGEGTTAGDSSNFTYNGTISGATWKDEQFCVFNACLSFDGSNAYVSSAYESGSMLDMDTGNFSVTLWFRHPLTQSGTDTLLARYNNAGFKVYMNSTGNICFGIDDDNSWGPDDSACSIETYKDSQWHQLKAVKTGTTSITLYIDGKQVAQDTSLAATGSLSGSSPTLYVGIDSDGTSNPWTGFIDDVKIHRDARTSKVSSDLNAKGSVNGTSTTLAAQNPINTIANGLIAFWKLDESAADSCTGGTNDACDSSGNGYDGAWTDGATVTSTAKYNRAVAFDGTDDYINTSSDFDFTSYNGFSVSAWVNTNSASTKQAIYNNGHGVIITLDSTGKLSAEIRSSTPTTSWQAMTGTSTLSANTWYHAVVVYEAGKPARLYLNGVLEATSTENLTYSHSGGTDDYIGKLISGVSDGPYPFNGEIDEVRIYNRALSTDEVVYLADLNVPPIAYWKMDEGTGTSMDDSSDNNYSSTFGSGMTSGDWVTGHKDKEYGLNFDGTSTDYIDVPSGLLSTDYGTVSMWVKTSTNFSNLGMLFYATPATTGSRDGNGSELEFHLNYTASEQIQFYIEAGPLGDDDTEIITTNTYADGQWHHVAVSWNIDGNAVIYVDGVPQVSIEHNTEVYGSSVLIRLGRVFASSRFYSGDMDEVKFYNYPRTHQQILEEYNENNRTVQDESPQYAVGYWDLDELNGTTARDRSLLANDLTLSSASWTTSGKYKNAWNGTGSNWLSRADDNDFDFPSGQDFSISMWAKSDSATNPGANQYLVSKETGASAGYAIWYTTSGGVTCGIDDDKTFTPEKTSSYATDIYDANWHHIMCVRNGTSLRLYIDGTLQATNSSGSGNGNLSNADVLTFGSRNAADDSDDFAGDLDEIKIYRFASTPDSTMESYYGDYSMVLGSLSTASDGTTPSNDAARAYCVPGDTSTCNPPVGEWKLDEKTGTSAYDTSGNGYTGTLTNSPAWVRGQKGSGVQFTSSSSQYITFGNVLKITDDITTQISFKVPSIPTSQTLYAYQDLMGGIPYKLHFDFFGDLAYVYGTVEGEHSFTFDYDFSPNTWYTVAVTDNASGTVKAYVNGKEVAVTETGTVDKGTTTSQLALGRNGQESANYFTGTLDNFIVYDYVRTPAQVAWDYNRGGPIAHYKLNECGSTVINDSSGNSYSATLTVGGSGTQTASGDCSDSGSAWGNGLNGKFNSSLNFDGTDDYIAGSGVSIFKTSGTTTTNVSYGAWVNATSSAASKHIIHKDTEILLGTNGSSIPYCTIGNSAATATGPSALSLNEWVHLFCTYNGTSLKLYINGREVASTAASSSITTTTNALQIGRASAGTNYFSGKIDDIHFYSYAATPMQVKTIMNGGSAIRF